MYALISAPVPSNTIYYTNKIFSIILSNDDQDFCSFFTIEIRKKKLSSSF